jgi:hypothetical protein
MSVKTWNWWSLRNGAFFTFSHWWKTGWNCTTPKHLISQIYYYYKHSESYGAMFDITYGLSCVQILHTEKLMAVLLCQKISLNIHECLAFLGSSGLHWNGFWFVLIITTRTLMKKIQYMLNILCFTYGIHNNIMEQIPSTIYFFSINM